MIGVKVNVRKSSEDVGILSCDTGELCAEDSTSSLGGRCASVSSNPVALGPHRELCTKCAGDKLGTTYRPACQNVDSSVRDNIACGSCNGPNACDDLVSSATIGANSCLGLKACSGAKGEMNIVVLLNH